MFNQLVQKTRGFVKGWLFQKDGTAAVEAAFVFPILLVLLLGTFDMGRGILSNQKTIRASQITADLITRARTVSVADVNEAVNAGELALHPFSTDTFGVEIVSVRFDEDSTPEVVWSELRGNITANANVLTDVASLAEPNGGVVVVTVEYDFEPVFAGFVIDQISMRETAFSRGRKSAVVGLE